MPNNVTILTMSNVTGDIAMRRLKIQDAEVMRIAIRQEIERTDESRYDHRLHGVLLVANGQSCGEVAGLFGEDLRTVQRWVRRFEGRGFDGLREGERPGRPRLLDARAPGSGSRATCARIRGPSVMRRTSGMARY